ncbi:MAG: hypothetical protein JOZ89_02025, partial [Gammaproteobacteria bacterium]|nr:hypothetical protein [Gammaproteobacteria bacterium]
MRPLAALLAILAGSAVALAVGLLMTWAVILFLPADEARFAPEHAALMRAIAVFTAFAAVSLGSFYAEQRERRWRLVPMPRRLLCSRSRSGCTGRSSRPKP